MKNDMDLLVKAILEANGIREDIAKIQKAVNKTSVRIPAKIDQNGLLDSVKQIAPDLEKALGKAIGKNIRIDDASLKKAVAQVESAYAKAARNSKTSRQNNQPAHSPAPAAQSGEQQTRIASSGQKQDNSADLTASWSDKVKQFWTKGSGWKAISGYLKKGVSKIRDSLSDLKEIDTILAEIGQTNSSLSKSKLTELGNDSFEKASKYGKSAVDYLLEVQKLSSAGYQNADEIAQLSLTLQSVGNISSDLASQYLISADKAYQFSGQASKLNAALNGQYNITSRNALSMNDFAEATRITASLAAEANIPIDKMSAAIGAMSAATQQSGDVAGRAFKTILMNLRQVSGTVDEGTGQIIRAEDLAKYEQACGALGVSLNEVKNGIVSLKDPMQILKGLSEAYSSLDAADPRKANLMEAVGGGDSGNQLNALLSNWSLYEKMLMEYSQGTGITFHDAANAANTWEGSLNKLSNTWTGTIANIADTNGIIGGINALNSLLGLINQLVSVLGSPGVIAVLGSGLLSKSGLGKRVKYCAPFCKTA